MSTTTEDRVAQRYIPAGYELVHQDENVHIYYGVTSRDLPAMYAFKAKAKNRLEAWSYRTEEQRDKRKDELIASFATRSEHMAERKAKRLQDHTVKVGDIFYSSWGYDQTNINFYQVISTTKRTVLVQEIAGNKEYEGTMHGSKTAVKDSFLLDTELGSRYPDQYQPFRRVVNMEGDRPCIKVESFEYAWLDDGRSHGFSEWA